MKVGLVLEGGGARGAYQVGAIKALRKKGIKIDVVVGTSIGAINGAFVAMNDFKNLYKIWNNATLNQFFVLNDAIIEDIKSKNIAKKNFGTLFEIIKNKGLDISNLKLLMKQYIIEDKIRKSNIDYGLVTFKLKNFQSLELFKKDIPKGQLTKYVLASAYHPLFKYEKIIDESYYLDGGIFNSCPVNMLYGRNLDVIYVIRLNNWPISMKVDKHTKLIKIKSKKKLDSILFFTPEEIKRTMKMGYYDTLKVLDNLDGNNYYFINESEDYYDKLILNEKLLLNYPGKTNKTKIIKIIEELMHQYNFDEYKIYNLKEVILILKLKIDKDNKYYEFIYNLKIF